MNLPHTVPGADLWRILGRVLLGLYFVGPGIMKITGFSGTVAYMEAHNVPFVPVLLVLTIVLQVGLGGALIAGFRVHIAAFILAGLTLVISIYMHNFWDMAEGVQRGHEMQNFIKNLGIMAGLLALAGSAQPVAPASRE